MTIRIFDLNIEEVLENWEVEHALREIIANALDEQLLSGTAEVEIFRDDQGNWHVRDFGRGLRIEHFTLNENKEKLHSTIGIIGKFGVGLKDALATFHRKGIGVIIRSLHGTFRLKKAHKYGFDDIVTLHIEYDDTPNAMCGTDVVLHGVSDSDVVKAKSLFLKFSDEHIIETTDYGQILQRKENSGRVYISGVFASEEPDFLFSYNITSLTDAMKKRLNRERLNVGRTTYADRIKDILRSAQSQVVKDVLIEYIRMRDTIGEQGGEMAWIEIRQKALNLISQREKVIFLTKQEMLSRPSILDNARRDGYLVIRIDDKEKEKLQIQRNQMRVLETYVQEYNNSFRYTFIDVHELTPEERHIYDLTPRILALITLNSNQIPPIRISETMRITSDETLGVWDPQIRAIVIKRSQLSDLSKYAATLLHEVGHATTGTVDATREFERVLTCYLGQVAAKAIERTTKEDQIEVRQQKVSRCFDINTLFKNSLRYVHRYVTRLIRLSRASLRRKSQ